MDKALLHAILFTPTRKGWGLPVLFEGDPGVAKTEIIEQVAAAMSLPLVTLSPGLHGEGAFGVVPVPIKTAMGTRLEYPPPSWTDEVEEGGVVFVDEVTTAPPTLQAPMLGLVAAKRVGSHALNPHTRVFGAANPPELAANGHDLAPPLANRFVWLKWSPPTVEEHCAFMLATASVICTDIVQTQQDPSTEEARVEAAWPAAFARAVAFETAFHRKTGGVWKNRCPKPDSEGLGRAWPSDRTWELATRALASADVHSLSDAQTEALIEGCIGIEAAAAFATYRREVDLPDIEEVLDNGVDPKFSAKRIDRIAAILAAAQALVTPKDAPKRTERAKALWKLLESVPASAKDVGVPTIQALVWQGLVSKESTLALAASKAVVKTAKGAPYT